MSSARANSRVGQSPAGGPHVPLSALADAALADGALADGVAGPLADHHSIDSVEQLELALSEPSSELVESLSHMNGDLLILGAGGKMGPSLARMARRAFDEVGAPRRVLAASRFSSPEQVAALEACGVEPLRGDLLNANFVRALPDVENVLYLVGLKFGSAAALAETWASNVYLAGVVAERFASSRIVALSTGNVYGLTPHAAGDGATESASPDPTGEYAMSTLGRERVFQHFSHHRQIPTTIVRLNYATELRYGVLVDLAQKVYRSEPVSLEMGYFNAIWQRDACEQILRSFECAACPPTILNVTGAEKLSCRQICERFGELLDREVQFTGAESSTALLSDASRAASLFGKPRTSIDQMLRLTADWVRRGGTTWNKPTRFQVRDGNF